MDDKTSLIDDPAEVEAGGARCQLLNSQLLQTSKLESIGQLAAGIAHEINTPMQFVNDNIEYLSDSLGALFKLLAVYDFNLSEKGPQKSWQERVSEINREKQLVRYDELCREIPQAILESIEGIHRVIDIVKAMKEFTHPGRDEKEEVDLNVAVQTSVTITRNRWKNSAEMQLDLDPYLPHLRCVPAEISQVLLNLIVNAADAIAEQTASGTQLGTITVRTRYVPGQVTLEVADTGIGIPEENRERIFYPFFTTKDVGHGTGQGLTICYGIVVQRLGGTIEVESVVGTGSRFIVHIPVDPIGGEHIEAEPTNNEEFLDTAVPIFAD